MHLTKMKPSPPQHCSPIPSGSLREWVSSSKRFVPKYRQNKYNINVFTRQKFSTPSALRRKNNTTTDWLVTVHGLGGGGRNFPPCPTVKRRWSSGRRCYGTWPPSNAKWLLNDCFCCTRFAAEVYADKSHTVTGLKQLRSHAAGLAVSNLDERETLAGRGGSDGGNGGTAIIIYTSGSTGTPKGNNNNLLTSISV